MLTNSGAILILAAIGLLMPALAGSSATRKEPIAFYVAPNGDDHWSGKLAAPNKAGTDGPFAGVARARDAVRALKQEPGGLAAPVTIALRSGTYFLEEPLVLSPEDSGTPDCPITYTSYRKEKAVLSGGREITGWHPVEIDGRKLWAAEVPEVKSGQWDFHQLFANNRRLARTRLPKEGFYHVAELADDTSAGWQSGQKRFRFKEGDISGSWRNLQDVDVIALTLWIESRLPIESVDEKQRIVNLARKSTFWLQDDFGGKGAHYYLENVFEALDTPGQWCLDRKAGMIYYLPRPGEDPRKMRFIAPKLAQLVKLVGAPEKKQLVEHLQFRNLTFSHTEWLLPADKAGSVQAAWEVPAAVALHGAKDCLFQGCTFTRIGDYAVEVAGDCEGNKIEANTITDLGAGGIKVTGGRGTLVQDNEIGDGGKLFTSAVGVFIQNSGYNQVLHNHIHDFYYTGVSVGWSWGYRKSAAVANIVEYNHIHDIGKGVISDMGGIYTLGVSPGTRLRYNLIHDINAYSYGGWGIYLDEGSTGILVENNVVYRTKTGGFHQHYGKDNIIRNNVFALAKVGQIQRTRAEEHLSFTFDRNIVYWTEGPLLHGNWTGSNFKFDHNLYWRKGDGKVDFAGRTLEQWHGLGMDTHSLIADPKFTAPEKGDYSLPPDSPALKLGFKPIDLSTVGPR